MNEDDHDVLTRIDERTECMQKQMNTFVTRVEFWPVRTLVYLATGIMLTTVVGGIIALVIKGN